MTTETKQFIHALKAFKDAADKLNTTWGNLQWVNEEGVELAEIPNRLYPFNESFDEITYSVGLWVDDSVERINSFKPVNP